jgi:Arc/MetJ-type ribon-helix-helix transcriptional regulator
MASTPTSPTEAHESRIEELRRIVDEALASGISSRTTDDIFAEAIELAKAHRTYRE